MFKKLLAFSSSLFIFAWVLAIDLPAEDTVSEEGREVSRDLPRTVEIPARFEEFVVGDTKLTGRTAIRIGMTASLFGCEKLGDEWIYVCPVAIDVLGQFEAEVPAGLKYFKLMMEVPSEGLPEGLLEGLPEGLLEGLPEGLSKNLPEGYTAVDQVVAPNGAYLDTGYKPNQDTRVVMDVTVQGALEYWFGCWTNNYNCGTFGLGNDGSYGIYYGIGDDGGSFKKDEGGQDGRVPDGRQSVEVTPWELKVNEEIWCEKVESSRKDFQLDQPLYLFAQNREGTAFVNAAQGSIICHGCSIYDNGMLVREFVPCVKLDSWEAAFYDMVEGELYTSASEVDFTVPVYDVTVGTLVNMTAAYTFNEGSVTNALNATSFSMAGGVTNLTVIYTAATGYCFDNNSTVKAVTRDKLTGDLDLTDEKPIVYKNQPTVIIEKITNRYPWNGKIDVEYRLRDVKSSFDPIDALVTKFTSGTVEVTKTNNLSKTELSTGKVKLTFDCAELFGEDKRDVEAQVTAKLLPLDYSYAIIDVSGGPSALSYPVTYYESFESLPIDRKKYPKEVISPEFKTDKIALYYVKKGSYYGNQYSPSIPSKNNTQTTTGFWISIFPITEAQYSNVIPNSTQTTNKKPKLGISYQTLRGSNNPDEMVKGSYFFKKLCDKTGLSGFDLPTESQWEIACRAGTTTPNFWGAKNATDYVWYADNSTNSLKDVGDKLPNAWGLYDMLGNVWELCRDGYESLNPTMINSSADVYGSRMNGSYVLRGGSYSSSINDCQSSSRKQGDAFIYLTDVGFRLSRMSSKGDFAWSETECDGWSTAVKFFFDTRSEKTIAGTEAEIITYSSDNWGAGGSGVTVWCTYDGGEKEELKSATDAGSFAWQPTLCWRYKFSHAVDGGETNEAVFVVNGLPGGEANPWTVGEGVTAYVKDRGLYLKGEGEFNQIEGDVPWSEYNEMLEGTYLPRKVKVSALVLSALPISVASTLPSEDVNPSGAISGAEFEQVQIVDGKAYLDFSVYTSDTVMNPNWSVATNGVIEVPAGGKQGFFYLLSKPSARSDVSHEPIAILR